MSVTTTSQTLAPAAGAPLGAHHDGRGASFALYSSVAEAVELCLFESQARSGSAPPTGRRIRWQGYLPDAPVGQRYGYRVRGPWDPASGVRCNPAKLLLDPYARAIAGDVTWNSAVYGHVADDPIKPDEQDSAPYVPKSLLTSCAV